MLRDKGPLVQDIQDKVCESTATKPVLLINKTLKFRLLKELRCLFPRLRQQKYPTHLFGAVIQWVEESSDFTFLVK